MSKRALISVSDKTGIIDFALALNELGYEVISTGGTYNALLEAGVNAIGISDVTGFPEILDGRVKTLHPAVHGALLSVRDNEKHQQQMQDNGLGYIDLVAVNLYPFKETIAKQGVTLEEAIENIDIGGPSMLRSAAKNYRDVTVVCDASDYQTVLEALRTEGNTSVSLRQQLSAKVFRHTARYDAMIADYLTKQVGETQPESLTLTFDRQQSLRYGENPHQQATFYRSSCSAQALGHSLAQAKQLQGKELSYNNLQDANAAVSIIREYQQPVVVAVKHMNPCAIATDSNIEQAWDKAYQADSVSIFGGIIATNQTVDASVAHKMSQIFLEVIIAPAFSQEALDILSAKKNLRLLTINNEASTDIEQQLVSISGGLLVQDLDQGSITQQELQLVTEKASSEQEQQDLLFAWKAVKHVKSNAIVVAKEGITVGIGAGQMNRVGAAKIALEQASNLGYKQQIVLASDAFLPFNDVVKLAADYGVTAIIQPGGSMRDKDSIDACNELGIAMYFTQMRHFKH